MTRFALLLTLSIVLNAGAQPQPTTLSCTDVPGLAPLLHAGHVVLLGEMHGTNESPLFLRNAVCTALQNGHAVTVGLEIPRTETAAVDAFFDAPEGEAAERRLLQGPIWQRTYQDGRASRAMRDLLNSLRAYRAAGLPVRVVLIDDPAVPARRDSAMSARIQTARAAAPDDVFLVLTGNVHNRLTVGTQWDASYEPMGYLLRRAVDAGRITSLDVAHAGGEAWVCFGSTASDCGVRSIGKRGAEGDGVTLFAKPDAQAYDGHYHVGRLTASLPAAAWTPTVAITIDDLPYVGGPQHLEDAARTAAQFVAALARYEAPASGFVTGAHVLVEGQVDARLDLLRRWRDGGVRLENHSFSHQSFHRLPLAAYLDDAAQGLLFPERIMRERSDSVRFYRHPFNHTGNTEEARRAFDAFLEKRGLRLAPFTVEHADYVFNALYMDARARSDSAAMARIGEAYLAQLDAAFAFAERLADETFGRPIPQTFLIHSNTLNADYLAQMLGRLQARGYRFVSFDEALRDAAYATPTRYVGDYGISWLHRWRHGMGRENRLREEPDPPRWILDAYQQRQGR
jgi:peptidoglycan/xylan/chitin deacetylase (PgdA/CDA1 family)